jgi:hypothetical protein
MCSPLELASRRGSILQSPRNSERQPGVESPCPETELVASSIRPHGISSLASQSNLSIPRWSGGDEWGARMSRSLPSQRNFEDVKKEARELLHELRRWDATALRRHASLDCEAGRFGARLADAQYIIAREYGCRSWQNLKQRLESNLQDISASSATILRDRCAK